MPRFGRNPPAPAIKHEDVKQDDLKQEVLSQEDLKQEDPKPAPRKRPTRYPGYHWDSAIHEAKEKARSEGIAELPASRVGRVFQDGQLISFIDTNPFGEREFIAYDGYDVLASVWEPALINELLHDLASLHIGRKAQSQHPDDIELAVTTAIMKDDEGAFCGWAVMFQPEVPPGKKRKQAHDQKHGKQMKRRTEH